MPDDFEGLIETENIVYKKIDWYTCSTVDGPHGPGNLPPHSEVPREMTCSAKEGEGVGRRRSRECRWLSTRIGICVRPLGGNDSMGPYREQKLAGGQ